MARAQQRLFRPSTSLGLSRIIRRNP
jgi:hypothetical protein